MNDNVLLAFVHIEKAAGTSLIHILRRHFLLRYLDARPIQSGNEKIFSSKDLRAALRLNPFLKCVGGHSIKPYSDIDQICQLRYVTLLRNPFKRYVSHYHYWNDRLGRNIEFRDFLTMDDMSNFQTKKIAGIADLALAKDILAEKFFLVGLVEAFDEFLVLLQTMLGQEKFSIEYVSRNIGLETRGTSDIASTYRDAIAERNDLDIDLYDFVRNELYPRYLETCSIEICNYSKSHLRVNTLSGIQQVKSYIDYAYRKLYCEPIIGIRRLLNGRSYSGHY